MAEDMIERAAKAVCAWNEEHVTPQLRLRVEWDDYFPEAQARCTGQARAAVVAFLGAVSPDILNRAGVPWSLEVVEAIDALKRIAQGER